MDNTLEVFETFKSIQGESSRAGRVCMFIRLAGCELACSWCDTPNARTLDGGLTTTLDALVAEALASGARLVEITGGEPLRQKATPELCERLLEEGFDVMVETNGAEDISRLPEGVKTIMDCKCPSSGVADKMRVANFAALGPRDEVKFAILDRRDYDYALSVVEKHGLAEKTEEISFSPVFLPGGGGCEPAELAEWMISDNVPATLRLQIHKVIWIEGEPKTHGAEGYC